MYENKGGRKKKQKNYTAKQLAAHDQARRVFARARAIWSKVKNCDPYAALRQAWAEEKSGKLKKAANNPRYGLKLMRTNPHEGVQVVEQAGKFHILIDGDDSGKYYMTREKAEEKAARM